MTRLFPCVALAFILTGCAGPATYRYANHILIPPGVKSAGVAQRTATVPVAATCSRSEDGVEIKGHGGAVRVTAKAAPLVGHPAGWLSTWGNTLEKNGCLKPGEGALLATRVTELLPLDPKAVYNLLHASVAIDGYVDLGADHRLKVVGPLMREGAPPGASAIGPPTQVSGNGGKITVELRASKDLLGYETAWFELLPLAGRPGTKIVFLSADDNVGGAVSHPEKPRLDYLRFGPDAAFYRLFYLTRVSRADHDLAVLAAPSAVAMEERTHEFIANPDRCTASPEYCILIPRESAVVPHLLVTLDGKQVPVVTGSNVGEAMKTAGIAKPETALATLRVERRFNGRLTPVEFDRASKDILELPLFGGEVIRW